MLALVVQDLLGLDLHGVHVRVPHERRLSLWRIGLVLHRRSRELLLDHAIGPLEHRI